MAETDRDVSKRFHRGLVVGKFSPLHRGHEKVIRCAIEACEEVCLISYSKPEMPGCEAARRESWIAALFPEVRHLAVTDERLQKWDGPRELPSNDDDDLTHRRFCGFLCREVLRVTVDAVFTSEDYGDGFAQELTRCFREGNPSAPAVEHVLVDRQRVEAPISGTAVRMDVHGLRHWLAPEVYASFVKRICLLGGESSGKSTLAAALAREIGTRHAAEYGRELWEAKGGALVFEDLLHIAETQVRREEAAAATSNQWLFCDTSPLTTLFYSRHLFGKAEPALETLAERPYHLVILCAPDFPFVQDGTRQLDAFRMLQHEWYQNELTRRNIPYHLATGSITERVDQVRHLLALPLDRVL